MQFLFKKIRVFSILVPVPVLVPGIHTCTCHKWKNVIGKINMLTKNREWYITSLSIDRSKLNRDKTFSAISMQGLYETGESPKEACLSCLTYGLEVGKIKALKY